MQQVSSFWRHDRDVFTILTVVGSFELSKNSSSSLQVATLKNSNSSTDVANKANTKFMIEWWLWKFWTHWSLMHWTGFFRKSGSQSIDQFMSHWTACFMESRSTHICFVHSVAASQVRVKSGQGCKAPIIAAQWSAFAISLRFARHTNHQYPSEACWLPSVNSSLQKCGAFSERDLFAAYRESK